MTAETAAVALHEARLRTLALVAPFSDYDMERVTTPIMSPLVWDLAHIAAYEDLWIAHRHGGRDLLRPELAAMYDAFETPRAARGDLPLLNRDGADRYLDEVRGRTDAVLGERGIGDGTTVELVLRHEHQHTETMLQAIELAAFDTAPGLDRVRPAGPSRGWTGLESVEVAAGPFWRGAGADGFAYDNERPRHRAEVAAFRIGQTPITNATFRQFVEDGGYDRPEFWTDAGWRFRCEQDLRHPAGWLRADSGAWLQRRVDGVAALDPDEPVVHISAHEADAFARAHGARLPTEAEWEKAASWDPASGETRRYPWGDISPEACDRRANLDQCALGPVPVGAYPDGAAPCGALGLLGDVWEWTSSVFTGYDGFTAYPYKEYSEVFFGDDYRVLRGGSWATRSHVATPTFRNWDLPQRRQIFSGVRLAWDA